jgi:hypothetical protein
LRRIFDFINHRLDSGSLLKGVCCLDAKFNHYRSEEKSILTIHSLPNFLTIKTLNVIQRVLTWFYFFSYIISQTSATKLSILVNTLSLDGGTGSVTRAVRKFIIHNSYNSRTNVSIAYYLTDLINFDNYSV